MKRLLVVSMLLAGCATAEPPPRGMLRPVGGPEAPEIAEHPEDPHRPGGPFDVRPVGSWEVDAGAPERVFPMSPGGTQYPTDSVMPGAIPQHG